LLEPSPVPTPSGTASKAPAVITPPAASSAAQPSPRDRFDRALALESSRPDEALAIYRDLARGDGPWAMNALYAEGRFELERGNKDAARRCFADYGQRYPNGPNARDARDLASKLE
jgi:hypothetical protein